MRILLIEDDPDLQTHIKQSLEQESYIVDASSDGNEGYFFATEYPIDAAIVDLGLPGMSGIEIIQALRAQGSVLPILILTARSRWQEKVEGLEAGADDYLVKPFQMEELRARLKALLRRSAGSATSELICQGLKLDPATEQVWLNNELLEVTAFEYRLLDYLMRHANEAVSKARLADYLYPHDNDRDSNVIEVLMGRLRKKLDPNGSLQPIETLRNRGYRFTLFDQ
ncbi:two-component system response regulator [Methyloprofundus sedimenti]|uniref:Two-component system response regulator n=2 Tax=Methyloprofundus sedimenti TaxID=1420851 RepID=A0A1V8M476_9GAMM|nr:response regulator transcription factor [Methyloprofundus sedimenti]OQK16308.1 two-component system response regulator [Methyloprofundus sedimenti]